MSRTRCSGSVSTAVQESSHPARQGLVTSRAKPVGGPKAARRDGSWVHLFLDCSAPKVLGTGSEEPMVRTRLYVVSQPTEPSASSTRPMTAPEPAVRATSDLPHEHPARARVLKDLARAQPAEKMWRYWGQVDLWPAHEEQEQHEWRKLLAEERWQLQKARPALARSDDPPHPDDSRLSALATPRWQLSPRANRPASHEVTREQVEGFPAASSALHPTLIEKPWPRHAERQPVLRGPRPATADGGEPGARVERAETTSGAVAPSDVARGKHAARPSTTPATSQSVRRSGPNLSPRSQPPPKPITTPKPFADETAEAAKARALALALAMRSPVVAKSRAVPRAVEAGWMRRPEQEWMMHSRGVRPELAMADGRKPRDDARTDAFWPDPQTYHVRSSLDSSLSARGPCAGHHRSLLLNFGGGGVLHLAALQAAEPE